MKRSVFVQPETIMAPNPAFATGFLFFLVTFALSLPGAAILGWQGLRRG